MATKKKVSVSTLKKRKPPLAKVVQLVMDGKTNRDSGHTDLAKDIAMMLKARDPATPLGKALSDLEHDMPNASHAALLKELKKGQE